MNRKLGFTSNFVIAITKSRVNVSPSTKSGKISNSYKLLMQHFSLILYTGIKLIPEVSFTEERDSED